METILKLFVAGLHADDNVDVAIAERKDKQQQRRLDRKAAAINVYCFGQYSLTVLLPGSSGPQYASTETHCSDNNLSRGIHEKRGVFLLVQFPSKRNERPIMA